MSSKFKKDDRNVHRKDAACIGEGDRMYEPQSPYREPWPKHYGWENKLFRGGKVVFITTKRKLKFTLVLRQAGRWFSSDTPVSSTNKTDHQHINEILWKVALNTISQPNQTTLQLKFVNYNH